MPEKSGMDSAPCVLRVGEARIAATASPKNAARSAVVRSDLDIDVSSLFLRQSPYDLNDSIETTQKSGFSALGTPVLRPA